MRDRRIYKKFKLAIQERRDRDLRRINKQYEKDLADLDRLWGMVSSNGASRTHITVTSGASLRVQVREVVAQLSVGERLNAPAIRDVVRERYPERRYVVGTLVSRELRVLEEMGVLETVEKAHASKPNVYHKIAEIPASEETNET